MYHMLAQASPAVIPSVLPVTTLAETYFQPGKLKIAAFLEALLQLAISHSPRLKLFSDPEKQHSKKHKGESLGGSTV